LVRPVMVSMDGSLLLIGVEAEVVLVDQPAVGGRDDALAGLEPVENLDETVRVLHALHEVTVDTYYKNDRVYRVGRGLTEAEVRDRLSRLPCVFSGRFDFRIDKLEHAREAGWFSFKVFEYRGKE